MNTRHLLPCLLLILTRSLLLSADAPTTTPAADANEKKTGNDPTKTTVYKADQQWAAIDWTPGRTLQGSALDFSGFLDAPAGKYGDVIIRDGKFSFAGAPEKVVRFFGTNLTHAAPFLSKEQCELVADQLAAAGFNAVRLHLSEPWLVKETGSTAFNPVQKDKMDYLISCLRKRGIYYIMTIYSGANFGPGMIKDIKEFSNREFRFQIKPLAMVSKDAMDYMREYARSLLTSKNPYTGVSPKDDSALLAVELTNENPLNNVKREYPEFTPIFTKKCREYLTEKEGKAPTDQEVENYYNRFLLQLQSRFYESMRDYLRNELGVKKLISDVNCRTNLGFTMVRNEMDYPDVHAYWDLYHYVGAEFGGGMFTPTGKGFKAYQLRYLNPITGLWSSQLQAAAPRIFGKPFSCGEFNMCYPAPDRMFTVPLQSALAGLQGWGMILHYCYASNPATMLTATPERRLILAGSPLFLLSERIGNMLFAQDEVAESKVKVPLIVTPEYIYQKVKTDESISPPSAYYRLGFTCQIGTVLVDGDKDLSEYPCVVIPNDMKDIPACVKRMKYFRADDQLAANLKDILPSLSLPIQRSTTGQLTIDSKQGWAAISTLKSECILLSKSVPSAAGKLVSISQNGTEATCFAGSLDGAPLERSKRLLVLYLTDLKNTGTIVDDRGKNGAPVVEEQGDLPHLIRQGEVSFAFHTGAQAMPRIWALKYDGSRATAVAPQKTADGFSFAARSVTSSEVFSAYEVVWDGEE